MMKKFLAVFLSLSVLLLNLNFTSIATTNDDKTEEIVLSTDTQKKVKKQKNKHKKTTAANHANEKFSTSHYGWKEVVNHPFKILWRGFGWGIIGSFVPVSGAGCIGFVCGVASKTFELYEQGCENAPV